MKYQLDKDNPIPAVDIFNTSKTGMIKPDDDRFANGWAYQDKAFYEYFNFFWNETSTSLNQVNPFLKSLDEEITEIKTQLTQASGGSIQFDTTQNNWFANSFMWLKGLIDKEVTDRTSAIKTASDSLSETINAKDSNLKSLISTETSERKSADTALGTKIDNEVTARTNADKTINDSLANKADKATTLAGYGITDGASKTDISNASVEDRKWANITGKPSTFPPSSHTHTISQITDLQNQLNGLKNDINIVLQSSSIETAVNLTKSRIGDLGTITLPSVDFSSGYTYVFHLKVTISRFSYKDVTPRTVNILVPQNGRKYSKIGGQTMYSYSDTSSEGSSVKMAITPSAKEGVYTPSDGIVGKITITNNSPGSTYWGYSFAEDLKIVECKINITPLF